MRETDNALAVRPRQDDRPENASATASHHHEPGWLPWAAKPIAPNFPICAALVILLYESQVAHRRLHAR